MALASIGTLWIGRELSWLEQLCLQSFLDHGHEVTLYAYDEVANVPEGVKIGDASSILPTERIIRHARTGSPAYHADVFRLHMLAQTDHIWADTDAYCCRPWEKPENGHFHGWISDEKPQVNNGVLGLPKSSRTLARMLEFTEDEYPVPPWFPARKREELQELKNKGEGVHVSLLPWGVWGPNALTWFLKETGEIEHSFPGHVLYPYPFAITGVSLNPARLRKARRLIREDTLSIHFWGRRFRNIVARHGGVPPQGSFVAELLKTHRIDPEPTRWMMQGARQEAEGEMGESEVDFSMFGDEDVANFVLQRSEVGNAGREIRAWMEGDDGPILEFARRNRAQILDGVMEVARRECSYFTDATDPLRPRRVADIGCGYALADLVLYRRYGCDLVLIDIETSDKRHFGFAGEGAGYASLDKARRFLEANGVPPEKITTINPNRQDLSEVPPVDLAISLASCGFHYPAETYAAFFRDQVSPGGAIVLDIRKGTGGVAYMKAFGKVSVLKKHGKYSTVLTVRDGPDG